MAVRVLILTLLLCLAPMQALGDCPLRTVTGTVGKRVLYIDEGCSLTEAPYDGFFIEQPHAIDLGRRAREYERLKEEPATEKKSWLMEVIPIAIIVLSGAVAGLSQL